MTPPIVPSQLPHAQLATPSSTAQGPSTPLFVDPKVHIISETLATPIPILETELGGHLPPQPLSAGNGHKLEPPVVLLHPPLSHSSVPLSGEVFPVVHVAPIRESSSSPSPPPPPPILPPMRLHPPSQEVGNISRDSLQEEFWGTIIKDYPILDFFKHVWRASSHDVPPGESAISISLQKAYRGVSTGPLRDAGGDSPYLKVFDNMLKELMVLVAKHGGFPRTQSLMDLPEEEWDELGFFGVLEKTKGIKALVNGKVIHAGLFGVCSIVSHK